MTAISTGVRPAPTIAVKTFDQLDGPLLEDAWTLYEGAFRELNTQAVLRHLMYRHEFDDVMADKRWGKYLAFDDDGTMIGLSTYTNDLDAVPLISPQYFERHWPEHYVARRIWYVGFVAVAPAGRGLRTFYTLVKTMEALSAVGNGISVIDYARVNEEVLRLPEVTTKTLDRISAERGMTVRPTRIDVQAFYLFEFQDLG